MVQPYMHGKKCLEDFKKLLRLGEVRSKMAPPPPLQCIPEELDLHPFGLDETDKDKAIDQENRLRKLANSLGRVFHGDETPIVPDWARATACPSYYM